MTKREATARARYLTAQLRAFLAIADRALASARQVQALRKAALKAAKR